MRSLDPRRRSHNNWVLAVSGCRSLAVGISLVENSSARSVAGTLLLIGSGASADSLAKALAARGVDVERANSASAATTADVLLPDLLVLAGDAAQNRGASVLAQLQADEHLAPTLVISTAQPSAADAAQVAYLTSIGGVDACAQRVCAVLAALLADPSAGARLQALADKLVGLSATSKAGDTARPIKRSAAAKDERAAKATTSLRVQPKESKQPAATEASSTQPATLSVQSPARAANTPQLAAKPVAKSSSLSPTAQQQVAASAAANAAQPRAANITQAGFARPSAPVKPQQPTAAATPESRAARAPQPSAGRPASTQSQTTDARAQPIAASKLDPATAVASSTPTTSVHAARPAATGVSAPAAPPTETTAAASPKVAPPALKPMRSTAPATIETTAAASPKAAPPALKPMTSVAPVATATASAHAEPTTHALQPKAAPPAFKPVASAARVAITTVSKPHKSAPDAPAAPDAQPELDDASRASVLELTFAISDLPPAPPLVPSVAKNDNAESAARSEQTPVAALASSSAKATGAPSLPPRQAPSQSLEPAAPRSQQTSISGAAASATAPSLPARQAPSPSQAPQSATGASAPSMRARQPLSHPFELAPEQAPQPSTSPSMRARQPLSHPFDPAARPAPQSDATGAGAPSMRARHPFDPAPRPAPQPSTSPPTTASTRARRAPSYPFEPAPRPSAAAPSSTTPSTRARKAPSYPFEPASPAQLQPTLAMRTIVRSAAPGRTPRNPLEPAVLATASQPSAATGAPAELPSNTAAQNTSARERPREPLQTPQAWPDAAAAPTPRRQRRLWVAGAVAAIGCSALAVYWVYDDSAVTPPGNPAAAALTQTPALVAPQQPLATAGAEPVQASAPSAPELEASARPQPAAEQSSTAARRTSSAATAAPAADLTTPAGRARALVDTGAEMLRQRRYGLAESMYMKALQESAEYPAAMADLVRVHLARRDGMEATRWAERLVATQNSALNQLLLGDALALRGNKSAAEEAWTKAARGGNAIARQRLADDDE